MVKSDSQIYTYNDKAYEFKDSLSEIDISIAGKDVQWVNFYGFDNTALIQKSFAEFGIHKLTKEDILQLTERPKIEEYENYIYVTLKNININNKRKITTEQISFVLTKNSVISYQERHGDIFGSIRNRIKLGEGIVRKKGADYLLYLLIEATLSGYENVLEKINGEIDDLNKILRTEVSDQIFNEIETCKVQLRFVKSAFHPFRDQISKLINSEHAIINEKTIPFFNDIRDGILYNSDEIDSAKNELDSLTNLYFARLSQQSNKVMQFLTIVAAIFIPLTFIAGVYGMNFKYMPELLTDSGYFVVWGVMITVAIVLVIYFKKRKWF